MPSTDPVRARAMLPSVDLEPAAGLAFSLGGAQQVFFGVGVGGASSKVS